MEDNEGGCFVIPDDFEAEVQEGPWAPDESLRVDPAEFEQHSAILLSDDDESIQKSLKYFSQLLLFPDAPIEKFYEANLIPVIHSLVKKYEKNGEKFLSALKVLEAALDDNKSVEIYNELDFCELFWQVAESNHPTNGDPIRKELFFIALNGLEGGFICQTFEKNEELAARLLGLLPPQLEAFNEDIESILWLFHNVIGRFEHQAVLERLLTYFNSPACESDPEGAGLVALCIALIHSNIFTEFQDREAIPNYYPDLLQRLYYLQNAGVFDSPDEKLHAVLYTLIGGIFSAYLWESESANLVKNTEFLDNAAADLASCTLQLKKEIYFCFTQVISGKAELISKLFEHESIMGMIVEDFATSKDEDILQDTSWILANGAECSPASGTMLFMKYKQLWVPFVKLMQLSDVFDDKYIAAVLAMLKHADTLLDNESVLFNPIALLFAEAGGLEVVDMQQLESFPGIKVIKSYFGENYENYLARKRGLMKKKAVS